MEFSFCLDRYEDVCLVVDGSPADETYDGTVRGTCLRWFIDLGDGFVFDGAGDPLDHPTLASKETLMGVLAVEYCRIVCGEEESEELHKAVRGLPSRHTIDTTIKTYGILDRSRTHVAVETEVTELQLVGPPVHEDLVRELEALLEQAKSGELQDLVAVGSCAGGDVVTVRMMQEDSARFTMLGALTRVTVQLANQIEADSIEEL